MTIGTTEPTRVTSRRSAHDATVTALLTSLFAGPRTTPADVTSPRAAYQDALYGRAVLVDLRPCAARRAGGGLGLGAVALDSDHGDALIRVQRLAETSPVVLVSTDGTLAARIAAHLRSLGLAWVDAVDGGFVAWQHAGLPVVAASAAPAA
ncbi:rhodanese-like domain-containing protein [Mobilicoccus massiliensis]|uniref:rhodanese-like domain-containing protein n=1 Tax=Mobilicoccus massiliensis TaxID=1522310 RepID=UPI000693D22C|nr:hypothetical protein [Mobilicoccus massiliensis]